MSAYYVSGFLPFFCKVVKMTILLLQPRRAIKAALKLVVGRLWKEGNIAESRERQKITSVLRIRRGRLTLLTVYEVALELPTLIFLEWFVLPECTSEIKGKTAELEKREQSEKELGKKMSYFMWKVDGLWVSHTPFPIMMIEWNSNTFVGWRQKCEIIMFFSENAQKLSLKFATVRVIALARDKTSSSSHGGVGLWILILTLSASISIAFIL